MGPIDKSNSFDTPYIDLDEWRDMPVRHRYVHGGFKGTDTRFSFYFAPEEQYQGRFYQYITPVPDSEVLSQGASGEEDKIGFSIASGAYFVETNGGGSGITAASGAQPDPSITVYRANAAVAAYSRVVAIEMYGGSRPYGYAFGGSGGAYRTIGGIENTDGVWDGVVPYVMGSPMAIPNVFSVRMHAMRVLKTKFPQIVDALEPGGSGDMYAGLNEKERQALREVTRMGFPPKAWFGYKTMGVQAFPVLYQGMVMADPRYFEDFWTVPGYLGADSPASFLDARIQHTSTIKAAVTASQARELGMTIGPMPGQARGTADAAWQRLEGKEMALPVAFQLTDPMPDVDFLGGDLMIKSGTATGQQVSLKQIEGDWVILGIADPRVLAGIRPGDDVQVDNSNYLAAQTYHRHQVPGPDYPVWDQFRDPDGKPIYPQRPMLLGPVFARGASGTVQSGKFKGKMIVVESLWDREAFPWQADWYRSQVKENLGDSMDEHFVLWYVDHALHGDVTRQEDPTRTISYLGVLQQALRDLGAWVEDGIAPPASTRYRVVDGQVIVPPSATERRGIQPVIVLKANGGEHAVVNAGQPVHFDAVIAVPPQTGTVVAAEWDFDGTGDYPVVEQLRASDTGDTGTQVTLTRTHTFAEPGTYFPVLRATSQRQSDVKTLCTRIQNLGRVRIVVK
jgi:PKD domain-containing protein